MKAFITLLSYILGYLFVFINFVSRPVIGYFRDDQIWAFFGSSDNEFSGNSKYMYLQIHSEYENIRPVWLTKNKQIKEDLNSKGLTSYLVYEPRGIYSMIRSGYILTSIQLSVYTFSLAGGATLVQLWHGIPLKKIESNKIIKYNPWYLIKYDYLVVNSKQEIGAFTHIRFKKALVSGYPRNDIFYKYIQYQDIGVNDTIKKKMDTLPPEATVFGYFPTWRGYENTKLEIDLDKINDILKNRGAYMVIKPHRYQDLHRGNGRSNILFHPPHGDPYPLLKMVDVLVADYSSITFDYLHTGGKVLYYIYDFEKYSQERGFYLDFREFSPGKKAYSSKEFKSVLANFEVDAQYTNQYSLVRQKLFENMDGNSVQDIVSAIR